MRKIWFEVIRWMKGIMIISAAGATSRMGAAVAVVNLYGYAILKEKNIVRSQRDHWR